jgi:hypothetical protein
MRRDDAALYDAKGAGKGAFRFAAVDAVAQETVVTQASRSPMKVCD